MLLQVHAGIYSTPAFARFRRSGTKSWTSCIGIYYIKHRLKTSVLEADFRCIYSIEKHAVA